MIKPRKFSFRKKNKALKVTPGPKNRHTLYVEAVGPDRCPGLQSSGAVEQPRVGLSEVGCHVGTQSYFEDIFFFFFAMGELGHPQCSEQSRDGAWLVPEKDYQVGYGSQV